MVRLKMMVDASDEPVEFCVENFEHGETIRIIRGPLEGLIGELVEVKGKHKVLVRLEKFGCAITTVPISFIVVEN
jgi:transcription antitermination factor NusG